MLDKKKERKELALRYAHLVSLDELTLEDGEELEFILEKSYEDNVLELMIYEIDTMADPSYSEEEELDEEDIPLWVTDDVLVVDNSEQDIEDCPDLSLHWKKANASFNLERTTAVNGFISSSSPANGDKEQVDQVFFLGFTSLFEADPNVFTLMVEATDNSTEDTLTFSIGTTIMLSNVPEALVIEDQMFTISDEVPEDAVRKFLFDPEWGNLLNANFYGTNFLAANFSGVALSDVEFYDFYPSFAVSIWEGEQQGEHVLEDLRPRVQVLTLAQILEWAWAVETGAKARAWPFEIMYGVSELYAIAGNHVTRTTHTDPNDTNDITNVTNNMDGIQSAQVTSWRPNFQDDAAGRLSLLPGPGGYTVNCSYDNAGRLNRLTDGADDLTVEVEYNYDADGQLKSIVQYAPYDSINSQFDYTYDDLGRQISTSTSDSLWGHRYDALGQLVQADFIGGVNPLYDSNPAGGSGGSDSGSVSDSGSGSSLGLGSGLVGSSGSVGSGGGGGGGNPDGGGNPRNSFNAAGGNYEILVEVGDVLEIINFGGIGSGANPSTETLAELDTLRFVGDDLSAKNLFLFMQGDDLVISSEIQDLSILILKDFEFRNLDNLANADNLLFAGDLHIEGSFDVWTTEWENGTVFDNNSVTFLNNLDNTVRGRNDSNDTRERQDNNQFSSSRNHLPSEPEPQLIPDSEYLHIRGRKLYELFPEPMRESTPDATAQGPETFILDVDLGAYFRSQPAPEPAPNLVPEEPELEPAEPTPGKIEEPSPELALEPGNSLSFDKFLENVEGRWNSSCCKAVLYPIILEDRIEIILSLPHRQRHHYRMAISQANLEMLFQQFRQSLNSFSGGDFFKPAQQLYDLLVRPAISALRKSNIENLVFVVDDALAEIPIAGLHDGKHYLIEEFSVSASPGLEFINPCPPSQQILNVVEDNFSGPDVYNIDFSDGTKAGTYCIEVDDIGKSPTFEIRGGVWEYEFWQQYLIDKCITYGNQTELLDDRYQGTIDEYEKALKILQPKFEWNEVLPKAKQCKRGVEQIYQDKVFWDEEVYIILELGHWLTNSDEQSRDSSLFLGTKTFSFIPKDIPTRISGESSTHLSYCPCHPEIVLKSADKYANLPDSLHVLGITIRNFVFRFLNLYLVNYVMLTSIKILTKLAYLPDTCNSETQLFHLGLKYCALSTLETLSDSDIDELQEILDIAEDNPELSLVIAEIDDLIFDRDFLMSPEEMKRFIEQKDRVKELILR